ncbi:ComF family protein [Acidihalobacter ferrooxydans]|nr:ComF family protein [Acidihalobacter ferrooxydans]
MRGIGLLRKGLDVIYPPVCVLCGAPGSAGRALCAACAGGLPQVEHACACCGRPLAPIAGTVCGRCLRRPPPYDAVFAPLRYAEPVDRLIAEFKFRGRLAHATLCAALLIDAAERAGRRPPALLLPVPLHRARLRERGYNQALEMARPLARHWGVRVDAFALRRVRATRAQMQLPARQRLRNLRGAFAVSSRARLPAAVAIVDDVMTTGATAAELARVLRRAGVKRVEIWALARAGEAR